MVQNSHCWWLSALCVWPAVCGC